MKAAILSKQVQRSEHARSTYTIYTEANQTIDSLKEPDAWAHIAEKIQQGDMLEIIAEDQSYYLLVLVTTAEKRFIRFNEIYRKVWHEESEESEEPEKVVIEHTGGGWFRILDNGVAVKEKIQGRAFADEQLEEYLKVKNG